jgi:hypothetical protein
MWAISPQFKVETAGQLVKDLILLSNSLTKWSRATTKLVKWTERAQEPDNYCITKPLSLHNLRCPWKKLLLAMPTKVKSLSLMIWHLRVVGKSTLLSPSLKSWVFRKMLPLASSTVFQIPQWLFQISIGSFHRNSSLRNNSNKTSTLEDKLSKIHLQWLWAKKRELIVIVRTELRTVAKFTH